MTAVAVRPQAATADSESGKRRRERLVLILLTGLCVVACATYQFWPVEGDWAYTMGLRARQLGALVVVGAAIGASSLVFQTISGSRIVTPGVMGLDTMYVFVQTLIVYVFGATALVRLGVEVRAATTMGAMTIFGVLLFSWLFRRGSRDLYVMVLVGIVLSGMFGALTSFATRLLTPDDFQTLQEVMFASFNTVDARLLTTAAVITVIALVVLGRLVRQLDVADLGHDQSVVLGLDYHRTVRRALVLVTVLVATSTALVGPMMFLGLVVANLTRRLLPTFRHAVLVPAAALVGVAVCVLGQLAVLRVFALTTPLSVVINLIGGGYFLWLITRSAKL